jgi:hypothetical protein
MAQGKVTTGYKVEPRTANEGKRIFAVMREYLYRGKYGTQLVTIYEDQGVADSISATLNVNKGSEY